MAKDVHDTLIRVLADQAADGWMDRCAATAATCGMSTEMNDRPLSANERIKENSQFLRGTIAEGLTIPQTGAIADDDQQLTKFHGIYLQDDRDLRAERGKQRMEKAFIFMARMRVPGGILTPAQYLAADRMARERGNGTLRLTTRQTIQFHGIIKSNLRPLIQGLHTEMLDTIAACGDVNRNVCASVVPWRRAGHAAVSQLAGDIATHLLPRSRAWHEIWIGEERVAGGVEEDEPIYGRTYMPRKFKIGVALPPHNDVDVFAQDLSFVAIEQRRNDRRLRRDRWRRHGDDPRRAGDLSSGRQRDRLLHAGARGRRRGSGRDHAARSRRSVEPQAGAVEIHHRPNGSRCVRRRS